MVSGILRPQRLGAGIEAEESGAQELLPGVPEAEQQAASDLPLAQGDPNQVRRGSRKVTTRATL